MSKIQEHLSQLQRIETPVPPQHIVSQPIGDITNALWRNFNHQHRRVCVWLAELMLYRDDNLQRLKDFLTNNWQLPSNEIEGVRMFVFIELEKMMECDPQNGVVQYMLGQFFHYDWGQASNPQKYWECAIKSADLGCAWGISSIGFCYDQGKWVDVNHSAAQSYYEVSALKGCPIGYWNWGISFLKLRNEEEAIKKIKHAARLKYTFAMNRMAREHSNRDERISILTHAARMNRNPFCLESLASLRGDLLASKLLSDPDRTKIIFLFIAAGRSPSTIDPKFLDHEKINFVTETNIVLQRPAVLRLLLIARLKEPQSLFYKDRLPLDIFKIIIGLSECLSDVPPTLQEIFNEAIPFDLSWFD